MRSCVCVECLFSRTPGPAPTLSGANQRAEKGGLPGPTPRNPRPCHGCFVLLEPTVLLCFISTDAGGI